MNKVQIKKSVSIEVASAMIRSIEQNCLDLFKDDEFSKRFAALRDYVGNMIDVIDGREITDFYMIVEYSPEMSLMPIAVDKQAEAQKLNY
jgi:hypothetical protein